MTDKCVAWHSKPLINPVTNRKIKKNGPIYKNLVQECGPPSSIKISQRISGSSRQRRSPSPSRRISGSSRQRRSPSPSRRPLELYCGNNGRDQGLINGTKILGTRYQCLKKGIGKGLKEPILIYNDEYEPIEDIKIFCGNGNILPQNKDRFGTRDECLRKGFAVGQKQKYTRDGEIQREPIILEDRGWYKVYLPPGSIAGRM
jgi:hypothetical protein